MDPQAPSQTPPPAPVKRSGGFLAVLGKIFIFVIIAGALLFGGYYLGAMGKKTTELTTPTPTVAAVSPTAFPPSPTAATQSTKTVKAGLASSTAFKPYSVDVPAGWTDARETTEAASIDKLTLTKDGYSVTIYQAAMGGGGCLYPGDKPSEMAQSFTDFADINGKSAQYRRSWNTPGAAKTVSYTICQKGTDDSYGSFTTFGVITVVSPNPVNSAVLTEIDGMIASMLKQ